MEASVRQDGLSVNVTSLKSVCSDYYRLYNWFLVVCMYAPLQQHTSQNDHTKEHWIEVNSSLLI